jgi:hypothetical protein
MTWLNEEPYMNCPNCGTVNDANNRFCLKCGTALAAASPAAATIPAPPQMPSAGWSSPPTTSPPGSWPPVQQPTYPPPYPQQQGGYPQPPALAIPAGVSTLNIWGPFAGYGTRRRHVGWLMNNQGQRKDELINKVESKFKERDVPGAFVSRQVLEARGVLVEARPYFLLRRGLVSAALYINQFGRDLFISLASYLKPPISNFRVMVVGLMVVFQLYAMFSYSSLLGAASSYSNSLSPFGGNAAAASALSNAFYVACCLGPLGFFNGLLLFLLFCFSGYKWLTEKDFWAVLRVPPNEFNEDDLMAMEKAVEETVRQSLTDLQLDPDDLRATTVTGGRLF